MCIKTAFKASSLCMIPAFVGFGAGTLSVTHPKVFLASLVLSVAVAIFVWLRSYTRAGTPTRQTEVEDVDVTAGAMLAVSFLFAFWTGLAFIGGHGLNAQGVLVSISTALLAAFTLTFVRRVIARQVRWVDAMVCWLFPAAADRQAERA